MKTLHINARFMQTLRKQNAKEREIFAKHLESGILPTPIVFWHNPANGLDEIIDGHHRYAHAQDHGLEFETFEMHCANESQAEAWIIYHQFSQRNVDDWAVSGYLSRAVALERGSDPTITKRVAVSRAAESAGVSERTVWRAEAEAKPKNPVELFKEAKAQLEQVLTRDKNKAIAAFKKEVIRDELDEDAAMDQWQTIEEEINERHQDRIDEVEALGLAAQEAVENNPGLKNAGNKRPQKKSQQALASQKRLLKSYEGLLKKIEGVRLDLTFDNRLILPKFAEIYASIEVIRADFPKPKARFGR